VEEYSLGDLVKITGAKPRALQVWAERGVIQPIKSTSGAGTGVHRLFSRSEAVIACIIHPFAEHQISIGELRIISMVLRGFIAGKHEPLEAAIGGDGDTLLIVKSAYNERGRFRYTIGIQEGTLFDFKNLNQPGAFCITIRLETYLSKLK
jgi:hypothetical protein